MFERTGWRRHGDSTLTQWQVVGQTPQAVQLTALIGPMWRLERQVTARPGQLELHSRARNLSDRRQPFTWGQHIVFPYCQVEAFRGEPAWTWPPDSPFAAAWPTQPRWAPSAESASRLDIAAVNGASAFSLDLRTGWRVCIEWEAATYPYLWMWQEKRSPRHPWHGHGCFLGAEPMSCSNDTGLADSVREGEAGWVEPNEAIETRITMTILPRESPDG